MGPVQLLELPDAGRQTGIRDELEWLHENDLIRLIDLLFVRRDAEGISAIETSDLVVDEAVDGGSVLGALIGYRAAGDRGAEAIAKAGCRSLLDAWVHPADVAAIGMIPAEDLPKATA